MLVVQRQRAAAARERAVIEHGETISNSSGFGGFCRSRLRKPKPSSSVVCMVSMN
jgi:hypothetical protein